MKIIPEIFIWLILIMIIFLIGYFSSLYISIPYLGGFNHVGPMPVIVLLSFYFAASSALLYAVNSFYMKQMNSKQNSPHPTYTDSFMKVFYIFRLRVNLSIPLAVSLFFIRIVWQCLDYSPYKIIYLDCFILSSLLLVLCLFFYFTYFEPSNS